MIDPGVNVGCIFPWENDIVILEGFSFKKKKKKKKETNFDHQLMSLKDFHIDG